MRARTEKVLTDAGTERWYTDMGFQRDVLLNAYNQSLMSGGEPIWIRTPAETTLAVVAAGPIPEAT